MKTFLGNKVEIYLCEIKRTAIGLEAFINDAIVEDMLSSDRQDFNFLSTACMETLNRFKHLTKSNKLMEVHLVDDGMEVNLPKGFGKHIPEKIKSNLLDDASKIGHLLIKVMDREESDDPELQSLLEETAREEWQKENEAYSRDLQEEFKGYKQLSPSILPEGILASRGKDHRGYCIQIEHEIHGYLGRLIITPHDSGHSQMLSEVSEDVMKDETKIAIFKDTLQSIETGMEMTYKMNHNINES